MQTEHSVGGFFRGESDAVVHFGRLKAARDDISAVHEFAAFVLALASADSFSIEQFDDLVRQCRNIVIHLVVDNKLTKLFVVGDIVLKLFAIVF